MKPRTFKSDAVSWQELCRVTGLGRDSVQRAIRNGQLPGGKIGGRYVVPLAAFNDYCHGIWRPANEPTPLPQPTPIDQRFVVREASA